MINRRFTLVETIIVILVLAVAGSILAPRVLVAVDSAIWLEGRSVAKQIQQAAKMLCMEKGENFKGWEHITLWDLGFTDQELDGKYFTRDSYSIKFRGYNDFIVTVTATKKLSFNKRVRPYLVTVDENMAWGFVE